MLPMRKKDSLRRVFFFGEGTSAGTRNAPAQLGPASRFPPRRVQAAAAHLQHRSGPAARQLVRSLRSSTLQKEATGYSRWFERLLAELGIEVWFGDAAKIKASPQAKDRSP